MNRIFDFTAMDDSGLWQSFSPNLPWSGAEGDTAAWTDATPSWGRLDVFYPNPLNNPNNLPVTDSVQNDALQLSIMPSPDTNLTAGKDWVAGEITQDAVITSGTFLSFTVCKTTNAPGINADVYLLSTGQGDSAEIDILETTDNGWQQTYHPGGNAPNPQVTTPLSSMGWHTVGLDFEKDMLSFFIDGKMTMQQPTSPDTNAAPMMLVLQATRGESTGAYAPGYWAGSANSSTPDVAAIRFANISEWATNPH